MKLEEAIATGQPLGVWSPDSGDRLLAAALPTAEGLWFADVYWRMASSNPFHFLRGAVSGEGPWKIGAAEVRVIDHGDPLTDEWNHWQEYCANTEDGRLSTREAALREIQEREL